jgi:hypothetical protein
MAFSVATLWIRRILSTLLMMSVFFMALAGGFSIFLSGDFSRGILALIYVIFGLILSRLL